MQNKVSKLGLGTVQFGTDYGISNKTGKTQGHEVEKILNTAKENHINYIDTASAYGNAEQVLGQLDLNEFRVVSKFMPPKKGSTIADELQQSFENLNLNRLYAYMAHRPISLLEDSDFWKDLNTLKSKRLIEKIGYSLNAPNELNQLLDKGYIPDIVQVPFNYFDQRFENQLLDLKHKGCEIHTRSTFLQGLFFMKPNELSTFFDEVKPVLKKLQEVHKKLGAALLDYVIQKDFIDHVIIGVENNAQFLKNISAVNHSKGIKALEVAISDRILMPSNWPQKTD